jgi:aminomethyltransferase
MKTTALREIHEKLGAKMVPFAGYLMPLEYSGITDEHLCVRQYAGMFDVSHMGEIWVKGPHALQFVQWVTSNDVSRLFPGKIQYSCFPNGKGGIVDDLLVYKFDDQKYLLVVNAANIEKDWNWLNSQNKIGVNLENSSDKISQLAIQGAKAVEILQHFTTVNLSAMKYYTFTTGEIAGVKDVIISATGYTGSKGFELYFYNNHAGKIWNTIFETGKEFGLKPIGLGARDTLRLEMGYCLYGNDIDDTTSPIEAGLGWITKFEDHKDFIDKQLLLSQLKKGTSKMLVGFKMIDRGIPRHDYEIKNEEGKIIGKVTSGTMSPILKEGIGMGYVQSAYSKPGNYIFINIREKLLKAEIVKPPFV